MTSDIDTDALGPRILVDDVPTAGRRVAASWPDAHPERHLLGTVWLRRLGSDFAVVALAYPTDDGRAVHLRIAPRDGTA